MNGRSGGCCMVRNGGGSAGGKYGMSKMDKIMLKYRPIAPKPVTNGSGSGGSENSDGYVKCVRSKRKYVRVNKNKNKNNTCKKRKVTTLSLLPEIPDRKDNEPVTGSSSDLLSPVQPSNWLTFNNQEQKVCYGVDPVVMKPVQQPRQPQVVSYVTVECVTDTWVDVQGLGFTDVERVKNLEMDTCPGFISDGQDRVVWANNAYRQMAGVGHVFGGDDMAVVLVRKDKRTVKPVIYPAFTCKVRVVTSAVNSHRSTASPASPTLTLPCDVWRMERGACAWRLDVKAALSLGR